MDIAKNDDILEKSGYLLLDRATLIENYRKLQRHVGPEVTLIPVVKGNCYGYGADEITDVLVNDCRVRVIGVGALCEGTAMRRRGVACDLMLLGGIAPQQYHIALHNDIIISIFRPECALAYEELCAAEGRVGRIQIKIETRMNRLGVRPGEDLAVLLTPVDTTKYEYLSLPDSARWGLLLPESSVLAGKAGVEREDLLSIPLILHQRIGLQQEIAHWAQIEIEQLHIGRRSRSSSCILQQLTTS